jgi:FMN reductase
MTTPPLHVLAVIGTLGRTSATGVIVRHLTGRLQTSGLIVDVLDLAEEPLALFNPDSSRTSDDFFRLKVRVERADVYILGTPDYHGSISSATKNFLDHFWQEFTGKLFAMVVGSHEKGLTVIDQLRTVARQCYAWSLPYGVSFADQIDIANGEIVSEPLRGRLEMLAHDVRVYGQLLACQRRADLAGTEPGFLAKLRRTELPTQFTVTARPQTKNTENTKRFAPA